MRQDDPQLQSLPPDHGCATSATVAQSLPILAMRHEIEAAIRAHQVVIVCGDTGCGKTTQLPKILMSLGYGAEGRRIGCTQPRRLAAVTVARRVAEESGRPVGDLVGYQHRFERKVSSETRIKFMTDGVLLAETRSDPRLRAYDAIIIDEAHERSLNIDFLLGILKRILAHRRDLRVVISSATLDSSLFSDFFGSAPVIDIPGRAYPVDIRYLPPAPDDADLPRDVCEAIASLPANGDILVFLPGERDIRDCASSLVRDRPGDDVIPLLASLPAAEQQRAFRLSHRRRIILATNVAETSVTIPGIRFVVDSGLARVPRYIHRTQVQRLQIEPISQASARQRAGRCGRLGPGVCVRLYSEEDFQRRDAHTPPEIMRSSLAGVILSMLDLRLGDIADFPFVNPPDAAQVRDGLRELLELRAITLASGGKALATPLGRKLARMPLEPRLARILFAASEAGVFTSVLPIVAAMACDDPRRRPIDERDKADAAHAAFRTPASDFASTLLLWRWWQEKSGSMSQSQLRRLCKAQYLSFPKMREWADIVSEITRLSAHLGLDTTRDSGDDEAIHRSLLHGLLGRLGMLDPEKRDYRGARGARFSIFPGSCLFKKHPQWIMAGELVETSRLYARSAAIIDPKWIEPVAGDLCRHSYHSPEWDAENGFVRATEQVTLHGLVIVKARRCDYSRIDPVMARELFIRHALVGCEFPHPPRLIADDIALIKSIRRREEKTRTPGLLDEDGLFAHFDSLVPDGICSCNAFRKWLFAATGTDRDALRLKESDWINGDGGRAGFPDAITIGKARMRLSYRHAPGEEDDGITCTCRRSEATSLRLWRSDWLVPGALPEKLMWMLSRLPSQTRRVLSPLQDTTSRLLTYLHPGSAPLVDAFSKAIYDNWGVRFPADALATTPPPPHLLVRFRVVDDATRREVASGRDLEAVLAKCGLAEKPAAPAARIEEPQVHISWDFGEIPEMTVAGNAGWEIRRYLALKDEGSGVSVRDYPDAATALAVHADGLARLFAITLGKEAKALSRHAPLPTQAALFLGGIGYDKVRVADDLLMAVCAEAFVRNMADVRSAEAFASRLDERRHALGAIHAEISRVFFEAVTAAAERSLALGTDARMSEATVAAVKSQMAWLVFPGFIRRVPLAALRNYRRYFDGIRVRLERARLSPDTDASREAQMAPYWERYRSAVTSSARNRCDAGKLSQYRWMVEEYRVSLFAQELKTPYPVSPKRLDALWAAATAT